MISSQILGNYLKRHTLIQSVLFVSLFFSLLNIAYTIMVVSVVRSWLLTWWVDRRFPFCLIPLWVFLLVSIVLFILGICCFPKNRVRLTFDKTNKLLICLTAITITWIVFALGLTHTLYIGDFNVLRVIQNAFSGTNLLELPVETIDVFPTLGDTVLIGYILAFLFLLLASWRALKNTLKKRPILTFEKGNYNLAIN